MANYLILNQNQVFNGLGTLTYTVATAGQFNVQVQSTFPSAPPVNSYANSGIGRGTIDGVIGAGSGMGLGAGTGGGGEGFTGGDLGTSHGGVGQGFGAGNSYQQPPVAASNAIASNPTTSAVAIIVSKNGSPIYSASSPAVAQSAIQFKTSFLAAAADSITVALTSSTSSDNQLSGVLSNISISQGL